MEFVINEKLYNELCQAVGKGKLAEHLKNLFGLKRCPRIKILTAV